MNSKVVLTSEIANDNPTLCLSALRYLNGCLQCQVLQNALKRNGNDLDKTLTSITCNPIINDELHKEYDRYCECRQKAHQYTTEADSIQDQILRGKPL